MKKIFAVVIFILLPIVSYGATSSELEELPDNKGYFETLGMFGAYGLMDDFTKKDLKDSNIGGGGFLYFNALNTIYGNFAIGVSSDYTNTKVDRNRFSANLDLIPVSFNLAYMTSSDFINGWIGAGVSYTFTQVRVNSGTTTDNINFGHQSKDNKGVLGGDFFAGVEYIFTQNKMFGIFFEFKYTLTEDLKYEKFLSEYNYNINEKINLSRMKFTLGISLHF